MKKFKIVILAVLGTLGACATGALVLDTLPNTKDKVDVSVNDVDIIGNAAADAKKKREELVKLSSELSVMKELQAETNSVLILEKNKVIDLTSQIEELKEIQNSNIAQIEVLEIEKVELENQISTLNNSIESKNKTIANLNSQITDKNNQIASLDQTNIDNQILIDELNMQVMDLQGQLDVANSDVLMYQQQLEPLEVELTEKQEQIDNLTSSNNTYRNKIKNLESQIAQKNTNISNLESALAESEAKVAVLEQKVDEYAQALSDFVIVHYVVDGLDTIQIQDKNSTFDFDVEAKSGYIFKGWSLTDGGELLSEDYILSDNITLYAVFAELQPVNVEFVTYTSSLKTKTYIWDNGFEDISLINAFANSTNNTSFEFLGWTRDVDAQSTDSLINLESEVFVEDTTLYGLLRCKTCDCVGTASHVVNTWFVDKFSSSGSVLDASAIITFDFDDDCFSVKYDKYIESYEFIEGKTFCGWSTIKDDLEFCFPRPSIYTEGYWYPIYVD